MIRKIYAANFKILKFDPENRAAHLAKRNFARVSLRSAILLNFARACDFARSRPIPTRVRDPAILRDPCAILRRALTSRRNSIATNFAIDRGKFKDYFV